MIRRLNKISSEIGWIILAFDNHDTYYTKIAEECAERIKKTQTLNQVCLITDSQSKKSIINYENFDYVIDVEDYGISVPGNKMSLDWTVWSLTPYKESIKIESDVFLYRNISHWIDLFRMKSVCCMSNVTTVDAVSVDKSIYRKSWQHYKLKEIYNALCYFRIDEKSQRFFTVVKQIFDNWPVVKKNFFHMPTEAQTDEVYALASLLTEDHIYVPADHLKIMHGKYNLTQGTNSQSSFEYQTQHTENFLSIGFIAQDYPVHLPEIKKNGKFSKSS